LTNTLQIESAVKVKKGIDHMLDMYTNSSQKDPRQATLVTQQSEAKKREIDALTRYQQRLHERLAAAKVNSNVVGRFQFGCSSGDF
jgi:hypothetical protein